MKSIEPITIIIAAAKTIQPAIGRAADPLYAVVVIRPPWSRAPARAPTHFVRSGSLSLAGRTSATRRGSLRSLGAPPARAPKHSDRPPCAPLPRAHRPRERTLGSSPLPPLSPCFGAERPRCEGRPARVREAPQ